MSSEASRIAESAKALQNAFDQTFAGTQALEAIPFEDVLGVRIGADPLALRLSEGAGLFVDRKIVPVPSPARELLGIVALRGIIVPVYDLGAILGYPYSSAPRWLLLTRGTTPVGLAFEAFEVHVRVPQASFAKSEASSTAREHLRGAVQVGGIMRPIIRIDSVIKAIARFTRADIPSKE